MGTAQSPVNETIYGTKTFANDIYTSHTQPSLILKDITYDASLDGVQGRFEVQEKNGKRISMIRSETHPPQFGITVPYSETRLTAHARDSSDNEISCNLEVFAQTNGVCFATVPYRTTGLGNNDIITKGNLEGLDHTFTGINTVPDLTSNSAGGQVANKNSIPRKTMCNTLSEFKTILPQLSLGDSIYVGNAIRNSNNTGAVAWSWSIYRGHDNDGYHFAEGSGWTGARNVPLFDFVYNDTNETITFRYYSESSGSGLVSQTFNVDVFDPGVNIFKYP